MQSSPGPLPSHLIDHFKQTVDTHPKLVDLSNEKKARVLDGILALLPQIAFTINIPAAVASAATVPGGVSPADSFVRNIFIRGGFWASDGKFYPASQIASIASA